MRLPDQQAHNKEKQIPGLKNFESQECKRRKSNISDIIAEKD